MKYLRQLLQETLNNIGVFLRSNRVGDGGGSIPSLPKEVVGLKNIANTRINPATEETLQTIVGNYALILDDYSTANIMYLGKAEIGSITSDPVWQIKKINQTTGIVITWADGDQLFNNIWDNRVSLTYS